MADDGLVRIGDIPLIAELQEKSKSLTRAQQKLIDTSMKIQQNPGSIEDAVWQHAVFCHVGLPRKRISDIEFERKSGEASILVTAGKLWQRGRWVQQPLPWGPKPRLILIYAITQARKRNSLKVSLGKDAAEFMERLGITPQGSEYRSLHQQLQALAACDFKIGSGFGRTDKLPTFEYIDLWQRDPHQLTLWTREIAFDPRFFASVLEHAVPLHEEAIAVLRGSALGLDIYAWLVQRLHRARGERIRWQAIKSQFGQEYASMRSFKQEFKATLADVLKAYPEACVKVTEEGLVLFKSPPPIPPKAMVTVPALP